MSFVVDDHGVMFWSGSKEGVGGTGTENKGGKVRGMGWLLGLIVGLSFLFEIPTIILYFV